MCPALCSLFLFEIIASLCATSTNFANGHRFMFSGDFRTVPPAFGNGLLILHLMHIWILVSFVLFCFPYWLRKNLKWNRTFLSCVFTSLHKRLRNTIGKSIFHFLLCKLSREQSNRIRNSNCFRQMGLIVWGEMRTFDIFGTVAIVLSLCTAWTTEESLCNPTIM